MWHICHWLTVKANCCLFIFCQQKRWGSFSQGSTAQNPINPTTYKSNHPSYNPFFVTAFSRIYFTWSIILHQFKYMEFHTFTITNKSFKNTNINNNNKAQYSALLHWWLSERLCNLEMACPCKTLGSLKCHNRNNNRNFKKAMCQIIKTMTMQVHHTFWCISLLPLHDCRM